MNADLITREAHLLLQEIASYEEPRLFMEEVLTLAELAKRAPDLREFSPTRSSVSGIETAPVARTPKGQSQGHIKDTEKRTAGITKQKPIMSHSEQTDRQQAIISILRTKGPS